MSWPYLGLRLLLLAAGGAAASEEKKPVPVYTNEDLDRISPFRDETGVSSRVAVPPLPTGSGRDGDDGRARSEAYWRREAERLRVRLQRARDRVDDLRARLAASEEASVGPRSGEARSRDAAQAEAWRRQAESLHVRLQRVRERIDDLRARIAEREAGTEAATRSRSRRARATSDPPLEGMRRQLAALEARVRDDETRFEERARREGALPGWLR